MRSRRALLALLLAAATLLGFAPAAALAAHLAPLAPSSERISPSADDRAAPRAVVRELPVGLPAGALPRDPSDLAPLARLALGPSGGQHLDLLLGADRDLPSQAGGDLSGKAYPGRYAEVDLLLDAAPDAGSTRAAGELGAGLVVLASKREPDGSAAHPSAAAVAYALLLRSRYVVGCDAEVDLLLLLASDNQPHDAVVSDQGGAAEAACPGDPTPGWILAQYLAGRARLATLPDLPEGEKDIAPDAFARAGDAAASLQAAYPGSADVRTLAGDVHLAAGRELGPSQPFTGRSELADALAAYGAAEALGGGRAALAGQARALLGLGRPSEALTVLGGVTDPPGPTFAGPGQEILLAAQEAAHDFSGAARTAAAMAREGRSAFPTSGPLFPRGQAPSLRFDTSVSLDVILAPCCGGAGGGDVQDVSFLPVFRSVPGLLTNVPWICPGFVERRDQLLAGQPEQALQGFPDEFASVRTDDGTACQLLETSMLRAVLEVETGRRTLPSDPLEREAVLDARQNLFRWGGDLDRAAAAALEWDRESGRGHYLPVERLGEIRYLQGRYDEAAALFDEALRRAQDGYQINFNQARARLDRGTALLAAGRTGEGLAGLRPLAADLDWIEASFRLGTGGRTDASTANQYAVLAYYTRLQLGDAERVADQPAAAIEDYDAARARLPLTDPSDTDVRQVFPGVLLNNEALALMAAGRDQEARAGALLAVGEDPGSPVFRLTAGSAGEQLGDTPAAERDDAAALALDPTLFPAANNLGVALARRGRVRDAATAFRRAVGARPDYATGWFNLGVVESRRGPLHLVQAQGALARAFALNQTLRDHTRTLVLDEQVYRTGLDVSKPLPPGWSFQRVSRREPVAALGLLAAFGLVVASSSAAGSQTGQLKQWIEASAATLARPRLLGRRRHVAWAASATVLTFAVATAWSGSAGATALVAYLLGVSVLTGVVLLARRVVGQHLGVRLVQRTWPPSLLLGLATGGLGLPWAPLPYVRAPARAGRVYLAAPVSLAILTVLLLLEGAVWSTPLTQSLAVSAATMTASLLLPLGPLDGSAIARRGQLLVGLGAAASLLLLVLGLG